MGPMKIKSAREMRFPKTAEKTVQSPGEFLSLAVLKALFARLLINDIIIITISALPSRLEGHQRISAIIFV